MLFFLGVGQLHAQSFVFTNTQSASPIAAFTTTNVFITATNASNTTNFTSITAPSTVSGHQFTHWTVGGVRMGDITGRAANPVTIVMSNANLSAVANYVPVTNYTGDTLVPDWFKLEYYGSTANNAASDSDLDGFDLATELFRGYHPRVFNGLVEGGVSRRRSETLVVLTSTNYSRVTVVSDPAGITNSFAVVTNTGTVTIPSSVSYSGYTFIGWFVGTNRMDSPQGLSLGNLTFSITNDTTFVAKFVLSTLDGDADGLLDGYELYNFNTLTNTSASDPDGDGFSIAVENFRSYSPQVFNELVEGGVSRRRSETLVVLTSTNYARVTVQSEPAGITNSFAVVTNTGTITLPSLISYSGYTFIGWFADTNRMDSPQGLSLGNLTFTITNDTTFVAKFVLNTLDADSDGLLDGYELYNFNTFTNTANSDPDGDGFTIAVENFRSYSPQVFNELVEGGVSRRRSETLAFVPAPPDFSQQPASTTNLVGANVPLSAVGHGVGTLAYQWRLNGVNLSGATNATLTLGNAQFTNSGSFSVVVTSPYGVSNSIPATVIVNDGTPGFNLGMTDFFPGPTFTDLNRTGLASNLGTTRQSGEPNHAGKPGTNSVWLTWRAPGSGIVRVSTLGSGFDTLLGVYTGASVSALERIASDDDSGGFYTSALVFNATSGVEYHFAVDGLGGAAGLLMLGWNLEMTTDEMPRIVAQTLGQTVAPGSRLPLQVQVTSQGVPSFQWFKNGLPIPGADRASLVLDNIQADDAGVYQAAVWVGSRTNRSAPASIQVSARTDLSAKDKLAELLAGSGQQGPVAQAVGARPAGLVSTALISLGSPATHSFNNFGSRTEQRDLIGATNAGRLWFATDNLATADTNALTPAVDGVFLVETRATGVELGVSVMSRGNDLSGPRQVGFATNSRPGFCRLAVPVKAGTNYFVVVSTTSTNSVQYTNDLVLVNGMLQIVQQPVGQPLPSGGVAMLRVLAVAGATVPAGSVVSGPEDLSYQWRVGGSAIPGATNSTYNATSNGTYSVTVSTSQGTSVISSDAVVGTPDPVAITSQPVNFSANLGQGTSVSVSASGSGPLFYQWRRNGVDIFGARGPTNRIDSVVIGDAGAYSVVISNVQNAVTSSVAMLTIAGDVPPSITIPPVGQTVLVGSNATFSVSATGTAPLAYQWFFNTTTALAGATNASLTVTNAQTNNAGRYTVLVTNIAGSVLSTPPAQLVMTHALFHPPMLPTQAQLFTTGFPLTIAGELGRPLRVQASQDLTNWVDVISFTNTAGALNFLDTTATNRTRRYYRVVGD